MMGGINTTFTLEMFPTAARGITLALCVTFGKLGSVISPFIAALVCYEIDEPYYWLVKVHSNLLYI